MVNVERGENLNAPAENNVERAAEQTPEQAVSAAVAVIENKDKDKDEEGFLESVGGFTVDAFRVSSVILWRTFLSVFKFAKKAIDKRGKMSFGDGMELGSEIFEFGEKKGNKK